MTWKSTFHQLAVYKTAAITLIVLGAGLWLMLADDRIKASYPNWHSFSGLIGQALFTAGLLGAVFDFAGKKALLDDLQETVAEQITSIGVSLSVGGGGVKRVESSMDSKAMVRDVFVRGEEVTLIQTWEPNAADIQGRLLELSTTGTRLVIYILSPECPAAKQRSRDLGHSDEEYVKNQIRGNIEEFSAFANAHNLQDQLEIYCYESAPPFALYAGQESAYVGFYWRALQSVQGPQLVIDVNSKFGERIKMHVEKIKGESERVYPADERS